MGDSLTLVRRHLVSFFALLAVLGVIIVELFAMHQIRVLAKVGRWLGIRRLLKPLDACPRPRGRHSQLPTLRARLDGAIELPCTGAQSLGDRRRHGACVLSISKVEASDGLALKPRRAKRMWAPQADTEL